MKTRLFLGAFLLHFLCYSQAENTAVQNLVESYQSYFKTDRKSVHLHLNKTVFLTGEHIWFNTYIFNQSQNMPSKAKEFVYVDLIDQKGEVFVRKTILFKNGIGKGDVFLNNTLPSGLYFLQVYTASMQNFEEDDSTKYPILINNASGDFKSFDYRKKLDEPNIKMVSESGQLLTGIFNKCAVRAIDRTGQPMLPDSAFLMGKDNKKITKIKFNGHGLGSFSFFAEDGVDYHLKLYKYGKAFSQKTPRIEQTGVSFSVTRNPYKNEIAVQVFDTRTETDELSKQLYLLIHKDQNMVDIPIKKYGTSKKFEFKIAYDLLFNGMNEFTIVDGLGKRHAKRLFLNLSELNSKSFNVNSGQINSDSVALSLHRRLVDSNAEDYLSISILPAATQSQRFRKKALFALQLEPHFKGAEWRDLWNKEINSFQDLNFFDELTFFARSKYEWKTILNKNLAVPETNLYTAALEGVVEPRDKTIKPKMVVLYSKTNELLMNAEVVNGKFGFQELVIENGSTLNLSLIGNNGKPYKANFSYIIKPIIAKFRHRFSTDEVHKSSEFVEELSGISDANTDRQQLQEVVVTAKRLKYQQFFQSYQAVKIDSTMVQMTIGDFVRQQGFTPTFISPTGRGRRAGTLQLAKRNNRCGTVFPAIVFDGAYDENLDPYQEIKLEYVDEIYWDRPRACGMIIVVFTNDKYKNRPRPDRQITSEEIIANHGFDSPSEFRRPDYFETNISSFKHFGVLGWQSISNQNKQSLKFKVPTESENKIMVIIEGLTNSGKIITENHLVTLN